jgi:hypothetical protein
MKMLFITEIDAFNIGGGLRSELRAFAAVGFKVIRDRHFVLL